MVRMHELTCFASPPSKLRLQTNFQGVGADDVTENDPVAIILGFVGFNPAQVE